MAYFDKHGVEFTDDQKTLVRCPKDFEGEYVIPEGTEIIESESFAECTKLTSITIPDSVTEIRPHSLCDNLRRIYYTGTLAQWCSITWGNHLFFVLGEYDLFIQGSIIEDLIIPNEIQEIKPFAFSGCSSIKSIVLPDSATKIDEMAFYDCYKLSKVSLGKNVTSIGDQAFDGCENLTTVTCDTKGMNSLKYIGRCANKYFLIAMCDIIIHKANANKQDLNDFKSPLSISWEKGEVSYSLKDPSIEVLQLVEKLYNSFVFDYVSRVRDYLEKADSSILITDYLNICLKKKNIEDYKSLTKDHMSVPLPSIVPYQTVEGTHWSYGDLLGLIHMLCLV